MKSKILFLIWECSGEESLMLCKFLVFQRSSVLPLSVYLCLHLLGRYWTNVYIVRLPVQFTFLITNHQWTVSDQEGKPLVQGNVSDQEVIPFLPSTLILLLSPS